MEEKAILQRDVGDSISRVISNYKKDGQVRKTIPYYQKLMATIDELWSKFEATDSIIRDEFPTELDHPYYTKNYYHSVKEIYEKYREEFNSNLKILQTTKTDVHKPSIAEVNVQSSQTSNYKHDMTRLVRKQEAIISSMQRALAIADSSNESKQFYELQEKTIQRHWMQIEDIHNSIWECSEDPKSIGYDSTRYISLEQEVQSALIKLAQQQDTFVDQRTTNTTVTKMSLPKIVLPKFDGDYLKWSQFHDLFNQMVDKRSMSNCEKMFYLKTNLTGEAERVIRHVGLSDDNYVSAWKLLQERYNNPRLQVSALLNRLLSQTSHSSESAAATAVKSLHDTIQECMHGLRNLGIKIDTWDPMLLHILTKKLDRSTLTLYEQSLSNPKDLQTMEHFLRFLETRFQSLEAIGVKGIKREDTERRRNISYNKATSSITTQKKSCSMCKAQHPLFACRTFLNLTPSDRLSHVRKNNLCVNCLQSGHTSYNCQLRGCVKCSKKHNSLVHLSTVAQPKLGPSISNSDHQQNLLTSNPETDNIPGSDNSVLAALSKNKKDGYVFLSTVIIKLAGQDGSSINCRAILDSGSQINIISERMIRKLNIPLSFRPMIIQGVGKSTKDSQRRANISLHSTTTNFTTRLEAVVLQQIVAPQPTKAFEITAWNIPDNIKLADPHFHQPGHIDLLIGAEFFHQLLCVGQIKLGRNLPLLQNTLLGWIVTGKVNEESPTTTTCGIYTAEEASLEQSISKFWKLEELPYSTSKRTIAEERCEEYFNRSTSRDTTGRFVVNLPFADTTEKLGASSEIALSRFHQLEHKLKRNQELYDQYIEFMNEYIQLGHMVEIDPKTIQTPHYFLPHFCVLKPDSSSTKLRVVFDASAKTSSNLSLNDILYAGPTIQDTLFTILLRFRLPKFVIKADIQKMYRQIRVREEDQNFQLIWWRPKPTQALKCYKLCTVTYGTTSAPYLATRCLQALAEDHSTKYPLGSQVLLKDFYVDDVMSGADSLLEAKDIQVQLSALLREGGFQLKKWCSNNQQLLTNVPLEDQEIPLSDDNNEGAVKTLGLIWRPKSDVFCIKTNCRPTKKFTKRTVASAIARIFDPLGIIAPVVIVAKLFLQEIWELKYDWDASLPEEMFTRWSKYYQCLQELSKFQVPRHVFGHHIPSSFQIHTFADASGKAYGAAVYIRSINKDGTVIVRLLCSKSRVAPITKTASGMKSMTIPRLELCAALLAAELAKRVKGDLKLDKINSFLWSDSQIVLSWINSNAESFQAFVANRVSSIQGLTSTSQWRYVQSGENPADVLSRGISPAKLQDHTLWKYGPRFLHGSESIWPPPYKSINSWSDEKKKIALVTTKNDNTEDIFEGIKHSNSFNKLKRIVAYCLRYAKLIKSRKFIPTIKSIRENQNKSRKSWPLSASDLETSLQFIIKEVQTHGFHKDIRFLKAHKELEKESPLKGLAVFLDENGVLRVGGRLQESNLPYDSKHPMLVPYSHPFVKMLMTELHINNNHIGPQGLLSITRQRFWPIKGKNIARAIIQHCTTCIKAKPQMYSQMMGNLPAARVQPARPFIKTGVDFCGPLWVHYRTRGSRPQKCYLSIFCCFATKAVHIEVVSDLTTDAFLGALRRFMSRRGHVTNLFCDNATNFVGAKNQLEELKTTVYAEQAQNKITTFCSAKGIDFHFIPPRAPHFGGLWEAAVKSAKHLLQCKIATASLTYEEICTITTEVEAILNSRPLTPMSSDPNDLAVLTPGHFLIGDSLKAVVDTKAEPFKGSLCTRWKLVSNIKREFWNRWSQEYLNQLQHRSKWKAKSENIKLGTVVIMKEDNTPIMKWPLGRIERLHHGKDGLVRVADVRTKSGVLRRPIHKLAPLVEDSETPSESQTNTLSSERKRRHDDSDVNEPSSSKSSKTTPTQRKARSTNPNLFTTLLLIGLLLPIVFASDVEVLRFNSSAPGIHFQRHGKISLVHDTWNLVVYYNLEPYHKDFQALDNSTIILEHLCNQLSSKVLCTQVIQQLRLIKHELEEDNLVPSTKPSTRRTKRGAIDIVGNIANSLFGVLDSKYADEISQQLQGIHSNEEHLMKLLKNHTSILDSTINIMKLSQEDMAKRQYALDIQLGQIVNHINNITDELHQDKVKELFLSWCTHATLIVINIQRMQTSIADVLSDTHQGRVNHLLITNQQLKTEMGKIRNHLAPGLRFPVETDELVQLYKLMTVKGHINSNHIIFQIELPLLGLEEFIAFEVIPIPAVTNKTLVIIEPSIQLLAANAHHDHYYPITKTELSACSTTNGDHYLCRQTHPVYQSGANFSMCEINLLNNNSNLSTCELNIIKTSSVWTKIPELNQWIFAVKEETMLNVVCNHQTSFIALKGNGILKLQPNCVAKNNHVTLQGQQIHSFNVQSSYTRLTDEVQFQDAIRLAAIRYNPSATSSFDQELNEIREQIKLQQLTLPNQIHTHNLPHIVMSSLGLLITLAVIGFLICKCFIKTSCRKQSSPPIPAPRSSSYTISV